MDKQTRIRALINRLARMDASSNRTGDINPVQRAALDYLARANRFSRAPSHVADYLGTTRGTMSQTLKALVQKGHIEEERLASDRRSICYSLTSEGRKTAAEGHLFEQALTSFDDDFLHTLGDGLETLLRHMLAANGGRSFGLCKTCRYHQAKGDGRYCSLLSMPLKPREGDQICHEHREPVSA